MTGETSMNNEFTNLVSALSEAPKLHSLNTNTYKTLNAFAIETVKNLLGKDQKGEVNFPEIGKISMPYFEMGEINSTHLFGLDELILFAFYEKSLARYNCVADIGANLGLHSVIMGKLGVNVLSFEPDPVHFSELRENLKLNGLSHEGIKQAAVSDKNGKASFTRVLGNTTGSHLSGAKDAPYGELEQFQVDVVCFRDILPSIQFAKIDVEGHEAKLILSTQGDDWKNFECVVEVGTENNRKAIFEHCKLLNLNMFSQKIGWEKVQNLSDAPCSYKEGSLFISKAAKMPW